MNSTLPKCTAQSDNTTGSLHDECVLRGIIPVEADGGIAALIKADAQKRPFTPEQIESFIEHYQQHQEVNEQAS